MPIFWHDSPYYAPLSSSAWFFYFGIRYAVSLIASWISHRNCPFIAYTWPGIYRSQLFLGMTKAVQVTGSRLSVEINSRILTWTIDGLDEDKDREQFFEAIPGFCGSDVVRAPARDSAPQLAFAKADATLGWAFYGFVRRTLTSSLVLEVDKIRRVIICMKAIDTAHLTHATIYVLGCIFDQGEAVLRTDAIVRSLRSRDNGEGGLCFQGIIAGVIASAPERDDRWISLATNQLGVSEAVLRYYLSNDIRLMVGHLMHVLRLISKFDIRN
ncbi:hypothetical protein BGW80DRAFT_1562338, partial [Lactifluus volemus]